MACEVLIMAGGTGGHIFPGLAVAEALRQRGVAVRWLGTPRGLENQLVPAAGIALEHITVSGLRGRGAAGWLSAPFKISRALWQARGILRRHHPGCVLSMGGYAAGPGGLAARLLGIPLVIHEQNRRPGLTNRWLARWARHVCAAFPDTFPAADKVTITGNPVRESITATPAPEQRFAMAHQPARVLVLGGSLGACFLNEHVPAVMAAVPEQLRPQIRHQAGKRTLDTALEAYRRHGIEAEVTPFIDDMAAAYNWADLVICRAGALTVSELMAVGVGAILAPFPFAVDDHQAANGQLLVDADAALLVRETEWRDEEVAARLGALLGAPEQRLKMAQNARNLHMEDAAGKVADMCMEVAQ